MCDSDNTTLRILMLGNNQIGNDGMAAMCRALRYACLRFSYVWNSYQYVQITGILSLFVVGGDCDATQRQFVAGFFINGAKPDWR